MRGMLRIISFSSLGTLLPALLLAQIHFVANLSGSQEPTQVNTPAAGTGSFTLNDDLTELKYVITYQGLSGTLSAGGHFHVGPAGVNGPIVKNVASAGESASATIAGSWKSTDSQPLTRALVESLLVGKIYVNFHTSANPGGEIRGQLVLTTGLYFVATLSGSQEPPPVSTPASGTGAFVLVPDRSQLKYDITYRGLSGTLSAGGHFHSAATGVNGPIVRNIASGGGAASATISGSWTSSDGTQPLTSALIDSLVAGKIYVNFHTSANPGGEIRGQLQLVGGSGFTARLSGAQENPPVTTGGSGTGWIWINDKRTEVKFEVSYFGLSGNLSAGGHFHAARTGINGGVVRNIASAGDSSSNTVSGSWKSTDASQPLTTALVESLLAGKTYINFHTSTNPGGEIRGQVDPATGLGFTARLDGTQENPPVSTAASGTAAVVLNAEKNQITYDVTYQGLSGTLSAGGHFHAAPRGVNGSIVRNVASGGLAASATLAGTWAVSDGTQPLTTALIDSLIAGKLYINFHTTANAGGEIRGQVGFGSDVVTAIERISDQVPETFQLFQNYPNPFNPSTSISFSVPSQMRLSLKIYNMLGQEIAALLDEVGQAGSFTLTFDASSLPSGVYFYRLLGEHGLVRTQKMTLLK